MCNFYGVPEAVAAEWQQAVDKYEAARKAAMATLAAECAPVAKYAPTSLRSNASKYDPVAGPAHRKCRASLDAAGAILAAERDRLGVVLD